MIGLTFSRLNEAENIGYIIPSEEIDLFLQDNRRWPLWTASPPCMTPCRRWKVPPWRTFLKVGPTIEGMVVHNPTRMTGLSAERNGMSSPESQHSGG